MNRKQTSTKQYYYRSSFFSQKSEVVTFPLNGLHIPYLALDIQGNIEWKKLGKSLDLSVSSQNAKYSIIFRQCRQSCNRHCPVEQRFTDSEPLWQTSNLSYRSSVYLPIFDTSQVIIHLIRCSCICFLTHVFVWFIQYEAGNLKEGPIDRKALPNIGGAIMGMLRRLGRAFGINENRSDEIAMEYPKNGFEHSNQLKSMEEGQR